VPRAGIPPGIPGFHAVARSAGIEYVPAGCAHGFQALTDPADVSYRIDRPHDPSEDVAIAADDPELAIGWPLPITLRSARDRAAPRLADALTLSRSS